MVNLREKIMVVGGKGLEIIEQYFDGKISGADIVKEASKMVTQAVKIEHMTQIQKNADRSFAIRLLPHLPKNEDMRNKYIQLTNPEIKPLLISMPKNK